MFEFEEDITQKLEVKIKVIGIGGCGGNVVNNMISCNLKGVDFIIANTDMQVLATSTVTNKIQLGSRLTRGLGAGGDPEIGKNAAIEDAEKIGELLQETDIVFITAGLGGGTGTGGAPVVAKIAKDLGILTIAVVTKPFTFEGNRRRKQAEKGEKELRDSVDTLITIPNQRLLSVAEKDTSLIDAFKIADNVLLQAVKGISDLIIIPGLINLDFADIKAVMSSMGIALMGMGIASGDKRCFEAASRAISSPLLEDLSIYGAGSILINITAGDSLTLHEINEVASLIQEEVHEDANIIFGAVLDSTLGDDLQVTVIATGFEPEEKKTKLQMTEPFTVPFTRRDDQDVPAYVRKNKKNGGREREPIRLGLIVDDSVMGEDEYSTPTFLRKQAD